VGGLRLKSGALKVWIFSTFFRRTPFGTLRRLFELRPTELADRSRGFWFKRGDGKSCGRGVDQGSVLRFAPCSARECRLRRRGSACPKAGRASTLGIERRRVKGRSIGRPWEDFHVRVRGFALAPAMNVTHNAIGRERYARGSRCRMCCLGFDLNSRKA
jgi:hypothetical protein